MGDDVPPRRPRTRVNVDGLNFYHAAFRRGGFADHKWLDLVRFCERALPRLTIHFGEFVEHAKRQWLVHPPVGGPRTAEVWVPEEKGSDVDLASLIEPVRMAREELGQTVGVFRVEGGQRRCIFGGHVDFIRTVRRGHFAAAQVPPGLTDSHGRRISKPREW
ncbi:MAG: hypothetical protein NTX16_11405 [Actinobacteria bacterium]|nr:hypothetical protein [Actinomycetota bacterium]